MAKSSINLLQELSIKQGYMPIYNFSEKRNDVNFEFVCHVSCKELKATGTGSSKKEAKHDAAQNMLSLLNPNNAVPTNTLSSSSVANVIQSPAKEMSSSCIQPAPSATINCNYVGMLQVNFMSSISNVTVQRLAVKVLIKSLLCTQEFYQQQNIPLTNILYKIVNDDGRIHMNTYIIEVSVGSLCARGTSCSKKLAKQEAAKNLLLRLNPSAANTNNSSPAYTLNIDKLNKEMLENNIRKLGTGIFDGVKERDNELKLEAERAKSLYLEIKEIKQENPSTIKDSHHLFERNYASKFRSITENMRIIRDNFTDQMDLWQIRRDIENTLKLKIQESIVPSTTNNRIICLRLLTKPRITQLGMGETVPIARSRATYNLIEAILIFLNV